VRERDRDWLELASFLVSVALHSFCLHLLILDTVGRTPLTGDQPVARPLPTHRINAYRYPCLEWDSNPRSKGSSERRGFMPETMPSL
jgi:hypothetical protein